MKRLPRLTRLLALRKVQAQSQALALALARQAAREAQAERDRWVQEARERWRPLAHGGQGPWRGEALMEAFVAVQQALGQAAQAASRAVEEESRAQAARAAWERAYRQTEAVRLLAQGAEDEERRQTERQGQQEVEEVLAFRRGRGWP